MCNCLKKFVLLALWICIQVSLEVNGENLAVISPAMAGSDLVEADFVYYKDFFFRKNNDFIPAKGCSLIRRKKDYRRLMASISTLRCKEQINILLPMRKIPSLQLTEKKQGYILLNLPVYGIKSVRAQLITVKAVRLNRDNDIAINSNMRVVTGLIKRHVSKVNTYILKNTADNKLMTVHATPEHPFYVKNHQRYMPVNQISCNDELLASDGSSMHLICSKGQCRHCGRPFNKGWPTSVYNLEIDHTHTFFIGSHPVLVHNCGESLRRTPDGEAGTGSAVGGGRQTADGEEERHILVMTELAKVKHEFKLKEKWLYPNIRVYSNYVESDSGGRELKIMLDNTATHFETVFSSEQWTFVEAVRDKRRAFHANELLRCQYEQALKQINFDISQPKHFVLRGIIDQEVLRVLRGEESLRSDYDRYSSSLAIYGNNFWSSSHGKWISRVLDEFNFKAGMISWHDSASNSIRIEVFPGQVL